MNNPTSAFKKMISECRTAMLAPIVLYVLSDVLVAASLIFLADSLGDFGEAALGMGLNASTLSIVNIVLSVFVAVFIAPFVQYAADYIMLKKSLIHDRHALTAFLGKSYEQAVIFNEGEIQERMEDDLNSLRIYWVNTRAYVINCVVILSMIVWELVSLRVTAGLVLFLCIALLFKLILPRLIKKAMVRFENAKKDYHLKRRNILNDFGCNLTFFRQYHITDGLKVRLDKLYQIFHKESEVKDIRLKSMNEAGQGFFAYVSMIVLLVAGAIFVAMGRANAGQIVTVMGLVPVLTEVFNYATEAVRVWPLLHNVADRAVIFYDGTYSDSDDATEIKDFDSIDIKNLSYSHHNDDHEDLIISGLSLHISAGDKVIIKGANGSGKTTLIKLICGLLTDYEGKILINGKPIDKWTLESWHNLIAVSTQQSHVFNCSIKENILFDKYYDGADFSGFSENDLNLSELNARDMSKNEIAQLSGGEKQAISIARAIEKGTKVLILDEPFNHLDKEKRAALAKYLNALDCTIIIVTHDLESINDLEYKTIQL